MIGNTLRRLSYLFINTKLGSWLCVAITQNIAWLDGVSLSLQSPYLIKSSMSYVVRYKEEDIDGPCGLRYKSLNFYYSTMNNAEPAHQLIRRDGYFEVCIFKHCLSIVCILLFWALLYQMGSLSFQRHPNYQHQTIIKEVRHIWCVTSLRVQCMVALRTISCFYSLQGLIAI